MPTKSTTEPIITLKEYIDVKILGVEKATNLAKESIDKRLDGMNEFRAALSDQNAEMIRRQEFDILHAALKFEIDTKQHYIEEELKVIHLAQANQEGKASQSYVNITLLVSVLALAVAIIDLFVRAK